MGSKRAEIDHLTEKHVENGIEKEGKKRKENRACWWEKEMGSLNLTFGYLDDSQQTVFKGQRSL